MLTSLLYGTILGASQVGCGTWRTIAVSRGLILSTILTSSVISISYFFGMMFIVNADLAGYIGFSLGAMVVTVWIAWREKKKAETECGEQSFLEHSL